MPELEPPLLGSCLIHMLRRLPEPLVSCVQGGMQPRSHLISAQVLATEERARLYSMQLMLDLVAEANRGSSCLLLEQVMTCTIFLPGHSCLILTLSSSPFPTSTHGQPKQKTWVCWKQS